MEFHWVGDFSAHDDSGHREQRPAGALLLLLLVDGPVVLDGAAQAALLEQRLDAAAGAEGIGAVAAGTGIVLVIHRFGKVCLVIEARFEKVFTAHVVFLPWPVSTRVDASRNRFSSAVTTGGGTRSAQTATWLPGRYISFPAGKYKPRPRLFFTVQPRPCSALRRSSSSWASTRSVTSFWTPM